MPTCDNHLCKKDLEGYVIRVDEKQGYFQFCDVYCLLECYLTLLLEGEEDGDGPDQPLSVTESEENWSPLLKQIIGDMAKLVDRYVGMERALDSLTDEWEKMAMEMDAELKGDNLTPEEQQILRDYVDATHIELRFEVWETSDPTPS